MLITSERAANIQFGYSTPSISAPHHGSGGFDRYPRRILLLRPSFELLKFSAEGSVVYKPGDHNIHPSRFGQRRRLVQVRTTLPQHRGVHSHNKQSSCQPYFESINFSIRLRTLFHNIYHNCSEQHQNDSHRDNNYPPRVPIRHDYPTEPNSEYSRKLAFGYYNILLWIVQLHLAKHLA